MDLLATLRRSGGIDALARQMELPPVTVFAGAEALLPALLEGLRAHTQRMGGGEQGIAAMLAIINGFGDGNLAAAVMGPDPLQSEMGDRIIAQFFGSHDAKHRLAEEVAAVSGQDGPVLERILPMLAMLVAGYISARAETDSIEDKGKGWLRELLMLQEPGEPRANSGTNG